MKCKVEKTKNANEVKIELTVEAQKFEEAIKKVYFLDLEKEKHHYK